MPTAYCPELSVSGFGAALLFLDLFKPLFKESQLARFTGLSIGDEAANRADAAAGNYFLCHTKAAKSYN